MISDMGSNFSLVYVFAHFAQLFFFAEPIRTNKKKRKKRTSMAYGRGLPRVKEASYGKKLKY